MKFCAPLVLGYYVESFLLVLTGHLHSGVAKEQNWVFNVFVSDAYLPLKYHK